MVKASVLRKPGFFFFFFFVCFSAIFEISTESSLASTFRKQMNQNSTKKSTLEHF